MAYYDEDTHPLLRELMAEYTKNYPPLCTNPSGETLFCPFDKKIWVIKFNRKKILYINEKVFNVEGNTSFVKLVNLVKKFPNKELGNHKNYKESGPGSITEPEITEIKKLLDNYINYIKGKAPQPLPEPEIKGDFPGLNQDNPFVKTPTEDITSPEITINDGLLYNKIEDIRKELECLISDGVVESDKLNILKWALVQTRPDQQNFRKKLLEIYGRKCAICAFSHEEALEAAHIKPYSKCNDFESAIPQNGILLCANHHRLYDSGNLLIHENGEWQTTNNLEKGKIDWPNDQKPSSEFFKWRNKDENT